MKAKFVKEGKQIYFQDRNGAKWSVECIDEMFEMIHMFNRLFDSVRHYKSERVDGKEFY